MIIVWLIIILIVIKLVYLYFKNKYGDKKNIIVLDSKKEYDKIHNTINQSIIKTENKNKLKQYIDTIS